MIGDRDAMAPGGDVPATTTKALLLDHFAALASAPGGVAKLRELILQLAVQGKLVPQDPADEPAAVLLERIAAEKKRLVKEGKIRKAKPLPPVKEDEVPYALADGWIWTRLEDIGIVNPRNNGYDDDLEASFIPMPLISEKYGETVRSEIRKWGEIKKGYTHFVENDVVCAKITPCFQNGKSAVIKGLINEIGAGTTELHVFRSINGFVDPHYVLIYLKSPNFLNCGISRMTGSAGQKRVPREYFSRNPFPLPPLPEQHRIVAKVDALMKLCDDLDAKQAVQTETHTKLGTAALAALSEAEDAAAFEDAWALVAGNFDLIVDSRENVAALRQTVLQLAVQGWLVKQDPADEPAEVLLERIAAEKKRIIKKGRSFESLDPEDYPHPIPDSWRFIHIGEITHSLKYGTSKKCDYNIVDGTPVLRIPNLVNGRIDHSDLKYALFEQKEKQDLNLQSGDLLLIRSNGSASLVGRSAVVTNQDERCVYAGYLIRFRTFNQEIDSHYIHLALETKYSREQIEFPIRTTSGVKNINSSEISRLIVPLPPLPEQHRIVAKVDALMKLCDDLDARIAEREEAGTKLIASVVAGASGC